MKEIIEKLSSYNILNYLIPGTLFAGFGEVITGYGFIQKDLVIGLVLYYFIGMVISRFGSLCLEPLLKRIKFVDFATYADFVKASKADAKIDTLSEANNTYRTMVSLILALGFLKLFELLMKWLQVTPEGSLWIAFLALFLLFLFSYRKQTSFIKERVEVAIDEKTEVSS